MSKYIYPAIFKQDGKFLTVSFPDFESCYTQGDNIADAFDAAADILCLTLYNLENSDGKIPKPSDIKSIKTSKNEFASLVDCDTMEYRKFFDNKAVKKTLTIPSWLNTISEKQGINFSAVLQEALKEKLKLNKETEAAISEVEHKIKTGQGGTQSVDKLFKELNIDI